MAEEQLAFGGEVESTAELDNCQYLTQVAWRPSADKRLTSAASQGDIATFAKHLRKQLRGVSQRSGKSGVTSALLQPLWSKRAFDADHEQWSNLLQKLHKQVTSSKSDAKRTSEVNNLVARELAAGGPFAGGPAGLLAWMTILSEVGDLLSDDVLVSVWRQTQEASRRLSMGDEEFDADAPDQQLLVQGELPWRSGLLFSSVKGAGKCRKAGQSCLRRELEGMTDGDGTPHARLLHRLPLTLAVFVRSMQAGLAAGEKLWSSASAERFEMLVERVSSLSLPDGRTALSNGASFAPASLMKSATMLSGLSKRQPSASRLLGMPDDAEIVGKKSRSKAHKVARPKRVPRFDKDESPSSQSDWAELACMRNNWQVGSDSCVIAHHESQPQVLLTAFEHSLIDGDWRTTVSQNGEFLSDDVSWECVCWFSDKDVDYIELQSKGGDVSFFRQVLLSRTDHWAMFADGLIGKEAAKYELTTQLPLADGVMTDRSERTREMGISQGKLKAKVYPLALDQQRVANAHGALTDDDASLTLRQTVTGKSVYAPMVIDWSPDRRKCEFQWRRLTVAEDGRSVPPDLASGFRLRIGKHQWLIYRSFHEGETARTVLGHHSPHETVIAEFPVSGDVEPLVMVEQ